MNVIEIIEEASKKYDVSNQVIIECLRDSIIITLGLGEVKEKITNNKLKIYEVYIDKKGKKKERIIHITKKKLKISKERMYDCIIKKYLKDKVKFIKNATKNMKILKGKILSKDRYGLNISTKFGNGFAPYNLLNENEKELYKKGEELYFHIHKISIKKNRINIVLDRVSKALAEYIVKKVLGDNYTIYEIDRKFNEKTKVYIDNLPTKSDRDLVTLSLNEKVIFIPLKGE